MVLSILTFKNSGVRLDSLNKELEPQSLYLVPVFGNTVDKS